MEVKIKKWSIVCPEEESSSNGHLLFLSNLDLLFANARHNPILYLYRQNSRFSNFFEVEVLKEALTKVLVVFSPVAGRMERDENGRISINCNGEGVLFVEAQTDSALSDISDLTPTQQLWQLFPSVDYSIPISSLPLLLLQLTKFSCGGVSLGVGWQHVLADAAGFLHFMNSWANLANGLPIPTSPFIDRTILRSRNPPKPTFHHVEYEPLSTMSCANTKPFSQMILEIKPDQINTLKAMLPTHTTFEILTAHIWRCACKARGVPNDVATTIELTVSSRSRMDPPVPPCYFGNIVSHTTTTGSCGELISEPLVNTVERIHKAIRKVDIEYVRSLIDYLELKDFATLKKGPENSTSPNLKIISWLRLPFYEVDFGWGKPVYFKGGHPWEGKGHILSSPNHDDGTLLLSICLETHHLPSFQKLFYDKSCISRM